MLYLISYDIPSTREGDRRRTKLARQLEALGLRVQLSVFEVEMPPEQLPRIAHQLEAFIDEQEDSLRIYPLCGTCLDKVLRLGREATFEHGHLVVW